MKRGRGRFFSAISMHQPRGKKQRAICSGSCVQFCPQGLVSGASPLEGQTDCKGVTAVSYTHLDVYKRQSGTRRLTTKLRC